MTVDEYIIITLKGDEAEALKIALGKQSNADHKSWGLNSYAREFLTELYDALPFREDVND